MFRSTKIKWEVVFPPPMTVPDPDPGARLRGEDLQVELGDFAIEDLDVVVPEGEVTAFIGPNGSGKTTLVRMLARLLEPDLGAVYLDGTAIDELSTREVAREMAILPQSTTTPEGVTVRELAGYGRHPHQGILATPDEEDAEAIAWALEVTGMDRFADRAVDSLSGGERQRAWLAMALAQGTDLLLLDEPTTFLDVRYQVEILSLVRSLNRDHGLTVGWVLHDLNQAAAHSDRIAVLDDGAITAFGTPEETLEPDLLEEVFEIPMTVTTHPTADAPYVIPVSPAAEGSPDATLPASTEP